MTDDLARRQAELVRALVEGDEPPPGFDRAALAATAEVLRRKRQAHGDDEGTEMPRNWWWWRGSRRDGSSVGNR